MTNHPTLTTEETKLMAEIDQLAEAYTQLRRAKGEPIVAQKDRHIQYAQAHAAIAVAEDARALRGLLEDLLIRDPAASAESGIPALRVVQRG